MALRRQASQATGGAVRARLLLRAAIAAAAAAAVSGAAAGAGASGTGPLPASPLGRGTIRLGPDVDGVVLNVGSNSDPVLAPWPRSRTAGRRIVTIAVEPDPWTIGRMMAVDRNRAAAERGDLVVLQLAVAETRGMQTLHVYNDGKSSSLSEANPALRHQEWAKKDMGGRTVPVMVVTLADVVEALPDDVPIVFLKTDMQGYDPAALRSAGGSLKGRVLYYMAECFLSEFQYVERDDCLLDLAPAASGAGLTTLTPRAMAALESTATSDRAPNPSYTDLYFVHPSEGAPAPWFAPWPGMWDLPKGAVGVLKSARHVDPYGTAKHDLEEAAQRSAERLREWRGPGDAMPADPRAFGHHERKPVLGLMKIFRPST